MHKNSSLKDIQQGMAGGIEKIERDGDEQQAEEDIEPPERFA